MQGGRQSSPAPASLMLSWPTQSTPSQVLAARRAHANSGRSAIRSERVDQCNWRLEAIYLAPMLGAECVQAPVHVVIIAATPTSVDVVSVPTSQCQVARFTIGSGPLAVDGHVEPVTPVSISPASP